MNYQTAQTPAPHGSQTSRPPVTPARMRRAFLITGTILAVVVALLVGFNLFRQSAMKAFFASNVPPPLAVNVETVTTGEFPNALTGIGSIAAVNWVTVAPEAEGRVESFSFVPGSEVKQGDILVELNKATEAAELANFRAQQKLAETTLRRMRDLSKQGAASQAQLDQAQSQYDVASAGIARVEAMIDQKTVRAPFDGVLGIRQVEMGQYMKAGDPIATLTNIDNLFVEFTMPEQAQPHLHLGQTLELSVDAYPERTFEGTLAVIDPRINPATRTITLQAVVDNADRALRPGMFANLRLILPPQLNTISVPETALDYSLYGNTVYLVAEGAPGEDGKATLTAKRTAVTIGKRHDGRVEVLSGLETGDRLITSGLVKLFDGSGIRINEKEALTKPDSIPVP